jgi:hypothetical protein
MSQLTFMSAKHSKFNELQHETADAFHAALWNAENRMHPNREWFAH